MLALFFLPACVPGTHWRDYAPKPYILEQGLRYGPEFRNELDLYRPNEPEPYRSAVVFFYGGGWKAGERRDYEYMAESLAARGLAVAVADYRLYPGVKYPTFLEDGADAVAWLHENAKAYGIDPNRIFVMGYSAGAYNALMLALDKRWMGGAGGEREWIRGAIGIAGPYAFLPSEDKTIGEIFSPAINQRTALPGFHADAGAPPVLLITPKFDDVADPQQSARLAELLRERGANARWESYMLVDHASILEHFDRTKRADSRIRDSVVGFIRVH